MKAVVKKKSTNGRMFSEFALRYMFYPLKNINFAGTQTKSPVSVPQFPVKEIVALEAINYKVADDNDAPYDDNGNPKELSEKTMGTNAQVSYIMGDTATGLVVSGMTVIDCLTDVDLKTVSEIEKLIFGKEKFTNCIDLRDYLVARKSQIKEGDLAILARETIGYILDGVNRCINYCNAQTIEIERDLSNTKLSKSAIDEYDKYLYDQIKKPYPENRTGTNMGNSLADALAPLLKLAQGNQAPLEAEKGFQEVEIENLKRQLVEKDNIIKELSGYEDENDAESEDTDSAN